MSLFKFHIPFDQKFYDGLTLFKANSIIRNGLVKPDMFDMVGLGKTSKLGTLSWGIPVRHCKIGSVLKDDPDTPCFVCYANGGHYISGSVEACYESRYDAWCTQEHWLEAMIFAIKTQVVEFRWFDSGDIQNPYMLHQIMEIVRRTPNVKHWLPTQEHEMFSDFVRLENNIPENIIVRLSSRKLGVNTAKDLAAELNSFPNVLGTVDSTYILPKDQWKESTQKCVAPNQDDKCLGCRKCYHEGEVAYKMKNEGRWRRNRKI